jgi:hypothetical protein
MLHFLSKCNIKIGGFLFGPDVTWWVPICMLHLMFECYICCRGCNIKLLKKTSKTGGLSNRLFLTFFSAT